MSETPTLTPISVIHRFFKVRGWTGSPNELGEMELYSPDLKFRVQMSAHGLMALQAWLPVEGFSQDPNRYQTIAEFTGDEWSDMQTELVSVGAMPWECPNCGEEGGEPRTAYSRELYGADADGNRGEWRDYEEEGCSKCVRGR